MITQEKEYAEISLDLETLGTKQDANIVSIGAVKFNLEDKEIFEDMKDPSRIYYVTLGLKQLNGTVEGGTLEWWFQQSEEARRVFRPSSSHVDLMDALIGLNNFVKEEDIEGVWGNGNMFDNAIIRNAYDRVNASRYSQLMPLWHFGLDLDLRTIKRVALKKVPDLDLNSLRQEGVHHNALDDAIIQALMMQRCWRAITGELHDSERRGSKV